MKWISDLSGCQNLAMPSNGKMIHHKLKILYPWEMAVECVDQIADVEAPWKGLRTLVESTNATISANQNEKLVFLRSKGTSMVQFMIIHQESMLL
ncbi:hypothetical protein MANES_02G182701v8 [Manihot esculenta]|uniref:Uncharacterized protein n=1 Tax=Manihot esculenta TaxID=3983 RepID=A0ACB7I8U6_MANES|nr:hypothetical protein MANES_02G182701v8 [Manihot esculenta]